MKNIPHALRDMDLLIEIDLKPVSGVYFLVSDSKIVYVGQSRNVHSRIRDHLQCKKFDRAFYIPVSHSDILDVEQYFIQKYKPILNKAGLTNFESKGSHDRVANTSIPKANQYDALLERVDRKVLSPGELLIIDDPGISSKYKVKFLSSAQYQKRKRKIWKEEGKI